MEHARYPLLKKVLTARGADGYSFPVFLPGPAGSGKTTAAQHLARDFGIDWHHNGAIDADYRLLGFIDAAGRYHDTEFRKAYETGGVYLFDEVDASNPNALVALNAALENQHCAFPDRTVERHKDCHIIAAANTYGTGATFDYVGRNKLDGATLDRFIFLAWPFDEELERALSTRPDWTEKVIGWRTCAQCAPSLRHLITPRATIRGSALLDVGLTEEEVIACTVKKGLSDSQWDELLQSGSRVSAADALKRWRAAQAEAGGAV